MKSNLIFLALLLFFSSCSVAPNIGMVNVLPDNEIIFDNNGSIYDNVTCTTVKSPGNNGSNSTNFLHVCDDNSIHFFSGGVNIMNITPDGTYSTSFTGNGENLTNVPCGANCGGNPFDQSLNISDNVTFSRLTFNGSGIFPTETQSYGGMEFGLNVQFLMRMDDVNSSGDPQDISKNEYDGTLMDGAFIDNVSGYFNNGSGYSNNDSYISVQEFPISAAAHTVSVWVKATNLSGFNSAYGAGVFRSTHGDAIGDFIIAVKPTGALYIYKWENAGSDTDGIRESAAGVIVADTWQHIAVVWDGINTITSYVDGVLIPDVDRDGTGTGWGSEHEIGRNYHSKTSYHWYGSIDEVLILNDTLNSTAVSNLYNITNNTFITGTTVAPMDIDWSYRTENGSMVIANNHTGVSLLFNHTGSVTIPKFAGFGSNKALCVNNFGELKLCD